MSKFNMAVEHEGESIVVMIEADVPPPGSSSVTQTGEGGGVLIIDHTPTAHHYVDRVTKAIHDLLDAPLALGRVVSGEEPQ